MSYRYRRSLVLAAVLLASAGAVWGITQGRVTGKVLDQNGEPVQGVNITVTTPELTDFELTTETNKKGRFSVTLLDATKNYNLRFEKDGYVTIEEMVDPTPGQIITREFEMISLEAARQQREEERQEEPGVPTGGLTKAQKIFNTGVEALQAGDVDTATERFEEAIEEDPGLAAGYSALAGIYYEQGDYEAAVEAAERALELEPQNIRALEVRYDAYAALGEKEKAEEAYEALEEIGGGADTAVRAYNFGAEAFRVGDLDTALSHFQRALEMDPSLVEAHTGLTLVYFRLGRYEEALAAAEKVLELDPQNARALSIRFDAYRAMGEEEKAEEALQALAASEPGLVAQSFFKQGLELYNDGQMEEAKEKFETVIDADPSYAEAYYYLGICYVNSGNTAQAKTMLEKFLELAPDDPEAPSAREMLQYLN